MIICCPDLIEDIWEIPTREEILRLKDEKLKNQLLERWEYTKNALGENPDTAGYFIYDDIFYDLYFDTDICIHRGYEEFFSGIKPMLDSREIMKKIRECSPKDEIKKYIVAKIIFCYLALDWYRNLTDKKIIRACNNPRKLNI